MLAIRTESRERLLTLLAKRSIPEPNSGCRIWLGPATRAGYGILRSGEVGTTAHRVALALHDGPIEDGYETHHLCGTKPCVEPSHLRKVEISAHRSAHGLVGHHYGNRTHCKNGHEYTDENTRTDKRGGRACRACARESHRRHPANPPARCGKGHELDEGNLYISPDGSAWNCRACGADRARRYRKERAIRRAVG